MKLANIPLKSFFSLLAIGLFSFLALPAWGQMDDNYRNFRNWDKDNNQRLSMEEFYAGATDLDIFNTWDENDNGSLEKKELRSGIYKKWESDGENFETRDEARVRTWGRYYAGTFDDWDTNGDGTVTRAEFSQRVGDEERKNMEKKMDINDNGEVTKKEFYSTLFKMWDDDEDGFLSQQEYNPDEYDSWFL